MKIYCLIYFHVDECCLYDGLKAEPLHHSRGRSQRPSELGCRGEAPAEIFYFLIRNCATKLEILMAKISYENPKSYDLGFGWEIPSLKIWDVCKIRKSQILRFGIWWGNPKS